MPRRCPDCNLDLDRFAERGSDRHRCLSGKLAGARAATRIERERIEAGQLDPSILLPKATQASSHPVGRLAPRGIHAKALALEQPNSDQRAPVSQANAAPRSEAQPSNREIMEAITKLTEKVEALVTNVTNKA